MNIGIFQKMYDLLETELHRVDLLLLREKALSDTERGQTLFDR